MGVRVVGGSGWDFGLGVSGFRGSGFGGSRFGAAVILSCCRALHLLQMSVGSASRLPNYRHRDLQLFCQKWLQGCLVTMPPACGRSGSRSRSPLCGDDRGHSSGSSLHVSPAEAAAALEAANIAVCTVQEAQVAWREVIASAAWLHHGDHMKKLAVARKKMFCDCWRSCRVSTGSPTILD